MANFVFEKINEKEKICLKTKDNICFSIVEICGNEMTINTRCANDSAKVIPEIFAEFSGFEKIDTVKFENFGCGIFEVKKGSESTYESICNEWVKFATTLLFNNHYYSLAFAGEDLLYK